MRTVDPKTRIPEMVERLKEPLLELRRTIIQSDPTGQLEQVLETPEAADQLGKLWRGFLKRKTWAAGDMLDGVAVLLLMAAGTQEG